MQGPQDPQFGSNPPGAEAYPPPQAGYTPVNGYREQPYPPQGYPPPNYAQQPPYPPPQGITPADQGLSDTAAGALAYITFIPALVFLLVAPYNARPFVKFHAFQSLGLAVTWIAIGVIGIIPVLGWIVLAVGLLALLVCWIMSIVKASQGSFFKLPLISDFASQQSGYPIA